MKIRYAGLVLLCLLAFAVALSCKSTPPAATPAPDTQASASPGVAVSERPSVNALEAAESRAVAARKLVSDFDGDTLMPDEWKTADSLFTDAERRKNTSNQQEISGSMARFIAAAEAFEGMSSGIYEKYHDAKESELIAARIAALEAGAEEYTPELLAEADGTVAVAMEKYEARDYYAAKDATTEALSMYQLLKSGLDVYEVRQTISDRGFEVYDPDAIAAADKTLLSAIPDYSERNLSGAQDKVDAALLGYNKVLQIAWESYAADAAAGAAAERQSAIEMRANIAMRQEFNTANDIYNRANTAFSERRFEAAARDFDDCINRFEVIKYLTHVKRITAEEALDRANQKVAESDEAAKSAEIVLEGGEL